VDFRVGRVAEPGVSRYIKNTKGKKDLISVAVEPTDSPVIAQALDSDQGCLE
jgi:cysteine synthase A